MNGRQDIPVGAVVSSVDVNHLAIAVVERTTVAKIVISAKWTSTAVARRATWLRCAPVPMCVGKVKKPPGVSERLLDGLILSHLITSPQRR